MNENMKLWELVEKTPIDQTKKITGKSYSGTSPKPHYLVQKATETFGPCGIGWGFTVEERVELGAMYEPGDFERMHVAKVKVWYKWNGERGEVEHVGGTPFSGRRSTGKPFTDEDAPKKSVTDALIKALSMIGFAGDIFMGRYDDSKYISELEEEAKEASKPTDAKKDASRNEDARQLFTTLNKDLRMCKHSDDVKRWWKDQECIDLRNKLPVSWQENLKKEMQEFGAILKQQETEEFPGDIKDVSGRKLHNVEA